MRIDIDWIELAIAYIETWYECPICQYREHIKGDVELHIRKSHTQPEIKEICSQ